MAALPFITSCSMNIKTKMCWQGTDRNLNSSGNNNESKFLPATDLLLNTHIQALHPFVISSSQAPTLPLRETIVKQLYTGRLVENGLVFRENFAVRSFDIGSNSKMTIGAVMNYLQETSINHLKKVGLQADGFGSSAKMNARNLIWVACSFHIEFDHYPSWKDVIQVDTWKYRTGKIGLGFDWHVRDSKTGKTLLRATSLYVLMNKKTRKFAKFSVEIVEEMKPYLKECHPILHKGSRKLVLLDIDNADRVRTGLMSGWTDIDVNQHVSHIKLINYLLEGVPRWVVETHELSWINLEYRNECNGDSELQSLSKVTSNNNNNNNHFTDNEGFEFHHLLRLECGKEIVRGRTTWKPKYKNIAENEVQT